MPYMTLSGLNDDTCVSVLSTASDSRPFTVTGSFLLLAPRPLSPGGTRKYSPPVHLTIEPSSRDLDPTLSLLTQAGPSRLHGVDRRRAGGQHGLCQRSDALPERRYHREKRRARLLRASIPQRLARIVRAAAKGVDGGEAYGIQSNVTMPPPSARMVHIRWERRERGHPAPRAARQRAAPPP